jgi:polysaccharide export outer membrane protein
MLCATTLKVAAVRLWAAQGRARLGAVLLAASLAACQTLPESGPPTRSIVDNAQKAADGKYYLVQVSPAILSVMRDQKPRALSPVFADGRSAPAQPIGVGDTVSVTIWENSGLFGVAQANQRRNDLPSPVVNVAGDSQATTLPDQAVDQNGEIKVPFAGRIPVAGLTPAQVEKSITTSLKGMTIGLQVVVNVTQNAANYATVTGDVNHPGRVPLALAGTRLLDAIALAGGATAPTSDTALQLTRGGVTRRVRLEAIVKDPAENIYLRTGDMLYLLKEPQSVVILGATNKNEQVQFGKSSITLAEVVGNGEGLADNRADPYGVFVFRYEPAWFAQSLGAQTSEADPNDLVPVVYQVNMKSPNGYFVAQAFSMHDRDLVYVANTDSVQLSKIAIFLNEFASLFKGSTSSYVTTN